MRQATNFRSNLSLRRTLIELNTQVDHLKDWIALNGSSDSFSSLSKSFEDRDHLPQVVFDILVLEDRRFFKHRGAEFRSIPRGLKRRVRTGKIGGTSTIDQLLVRTCIQRSERTFARKARETLLALLINLHCGKDEIALSFVNSAYFGSRMYGADSASILLFGLQAIQLRGDYSAFVASLLPYPVPVNVSKFVRTVHSFSHPFDLLRAFEVSNPWWVGRVRARMEYLKDLRPKYSAASLLAASR
ncbi:transglycosylase domain-containing protein [Paracoccus sp. R12_1]|uniref:biosynthetic peptidoglycan transglycosylase n=1 Tax=Paracoccus sp. TaxID=267 RepID=UPI001ADB0C18|nr:transglycosylase domain-containing protein [Paracoccus sp. R12_2]MBO9487067.1 transglycosylase domain-containing protein [Paracoccus sp. R12_1]